MTVFRMLLAAGFALTAGVLVENAKATSQCATGEAACVIVPASPRLN